MWQNPVADESNLAAEAKTSLIYSLSSHLAIDGGKRKKKKTMDLTPAAPRLLLR